jgi:hypothetical protein
MLLAAGLLMVLGLGLAAWGALRVARPAFSGPKRS